MRKTMTVLGILWGFASGCGGDSKDVSDAGQNTTAGTGGTIGTGTSGSGGTGSSTTGTSGSSGGGSGTGSTPGSGGGTEPGSTIPTNGEQFSFCDDDQDCADGLNCYQTGSYCSGACAEDADCSALGAEYTCSGAIGGGGPGGGFPGGGFGDAGAAMATGVCRVTCEGEDDASCPSGLSCLNVGGAMPGGGFPGGGGDAGTSTGTFRCGYPEPPPNQGGTDAGAGAGTTPAFGECQGDGDCADGLGCTAFGGGSGYCSQTCMDDGDCSQAPGSGTAVAACGFGGLCSLDCAADENGCPDGMTCTTFGGGGGGGISFAFCNY